jgi:hypothetical protein
MKRQTMQIGRPLSIPVEWYDHVCIEHAKSALNYSGEIVGWRDTQVIVRVKDYAVLRFWKKTGLEVGNGDHQRRGFRIDLKEMEESLKAPPGVSVEIALGEDGSQSADSNP